MEFRADPEFAVVREYFREQESGPYIQDLEFTDLRSQVALAIKHQPEEQVKTRSRAAIRTIMNAVIAACGVSVEEQRFVRIAGALPRQ